MPDTKVCKHCKEEKDINEFRLQQNKYRRPECKDCARKANNLRPRSPRTFWTKLSSNLRRHQRGFLTPTELREIIGEPDQCYLCGKPLCRAEAELDHVVPLSQSGESTAENLKWTHWRCNRMKGSMTLAEMLERMQAIIEFQSSDA